MAITYTKDIPDFTTKVKQITDITELETTVDQLSASMLEVQGDVSTLAGAVEEIAIDISQLSASNLPYDSNISTKEKIDSIVDDFVVLDDSGFTWDSNNKRFSTNLVLSSYKAIIANATNGSAVMGTFYSSQNNILYVYGFIPALGSSIDGTYHFKVLIIK